jgi:hypothetical protein
LIVNGYKDIEDRSWSTRYRGPLLIHAAAKKPNTNFLREVERHFRIKLPGVFELGGIVGITDVVDCVTESRSR